MTRIWKSHHYYATGCALAAMLTFVSSADAAIFDEAAGAGPTQAYYGNWGVDANASDPAPNSYNNYRKTNSTACPSPADCDLAVAFPDDGTDTATWSNTSHPGNPLKSPGMFIGQSPSTRSYEDNVFSLGALFDFEGGGKYNDSISRTEWDFRVGFLEDAEEFVAQRQANDESWDLWAADWGTDGVSLQMVTGASDDDNGSPIGSDEQFVRANGKGIVLQGGGVPDLAHEGQRDGFPNGVQTTAMEAFGPAGIVDAPNASTSTGAAYDELLNVSWWLEPVDGSQEVTFYVNVGEVLYQQSFDPGSPDDPKIPNPSNDPENPFTEGFFDWQNATPVFFVGAIGGTVDGTGQMGFSNPNAGNGPACDFDESGVCDIADLNELLYTGLTSGDSKYDLDQSGSVDLGDRDALLVEIGSLPGDANGDGVANATDLNALGSNWQQDGLTSWEQGDFDGNGTANAADLNVLGNNWQETAAEFAGGAAAPAAVPEPSSLGMLLISLVGWMGFRKRR